MAAPLLTHDTHEFERFERDLKLLQGDLKGFELLAKHLHKLTGISLPQNPKNLSLVSSRINKILRDRKFKTYQEYYAALLQNKEGMSQEFISALTTNTTQFFREDDHFEFLKHNLGKMLTAKKKSGKGAAHELRVWCSAASTGQEPYSILMTLLETVPELSQWNLKFLATDIDLEVLSRAAGGIYSPKDLEGLTPHFLSKYFHIGFSGQEKVYRMKAEFRNMIQFAPFNLMSDPYPFRHHFDIIFCRNVLIYFNQPDGTAVVENLASFLSKEGVLFLGHSESGFLRSKNMRSFGHSIFTQMDAPLYDTGFRKFAR